MMRRTAIAGTLLWLLLAHPSFGQRLAPAPNRADVLARQAAEALFARSDLERARTTADAALKVDAANREALFVLMETAALQADAPTELETAVRLCETGSSDVRGNIAAARVLDLAANTSDFRAIAPRVRALAEAETPQASYLRAAMLAAAEDGLPAPSVLELAHRAGVLTDWRMAGPFGKFGNVEFERPWAPERDALASASYGHLAVEQFRFDDGNVALPEYFVRGGVYYAASQLALASGGEWRLRVESAGTLAVFVDGKSVLVRDDRFHSLPVIVHAHMRLAAGRHTLLVKFLSSASPFRLAVVPAREGTQAEGNRRAGIPPEEAVYLSAAQKYWSGAFSGAVAMLDAHGHHRSAPLQFLLAEAWAHLDSGTPEEFTALTAVLTAAPTAFAAETKLAERALSEDRLDEALAQLRPVLAVRNNFSPAQEVHFQLATRMHWQREVSEAIAARVRLHPNCATLHDAARFYAESSQYQKAAEVELAMRSCAPGSQAYVEAMSDSGRHREAANAAAAVVQEHPLDRDARALLVRELRLAGDFAGASEAAEALHALAPNSERFRKLAFQAMQQRPALLEDDVQRVSTLGDAFYSPYRREGMQVVHDAAARQFSGGPAVTLLDDRVVRIRRNGEAEVYVHKLSRVLDRDGIEQYGEVAIPKGADLIELRTIKPDGSIAEPEFSSQKATVSMPALAPGVVIEQEYVSRYPGGLPPDFTYEFGSFAAPLLNARLAVISPAGSPARTLSTPGAPPPRVSVVAGEEVKVWDRTNIAQSVEETAMPHGHQFPEIQIVAGPAHTWARVRDYYRDLMIDATRASARVQQLASSIPGATQEEKAHALYRFVTAKVRGGNSALTRGVTPAEDSLGAREGSRTATLIAAARLLGMSPELVLGREVGFTVGPEPLINSYTRALVRLWLFGGDGTRHAVVVDAESEGIPFGALPPAIDRTQALLVPIDNPASGDPAFIALPDAMTSEQSLASADVFLDDAGNLSADLHITLGTSRSMQMRAVLHGIPVAGRQHFFEQLAMRIFTGATAVTGRVRGENDFEHPLELDIRCRSPHFISFNGRIADIDQLVPALSLRKMYVRSGERHFPLYLDMPFFETTRFRVHLSPAVRVAQVASNYSGNNRFGRYSVEFQQLSPHLWEIARSFRIPVQVVAPEQYSAFASFATQIDDAERQRLMLERDETAQNREPLRAR